MAESNLDELVRKCEATIKNENKKVIIIDVLTTISAFMESHSDEVQEIFGLTGVLFFIKDQAIGLYRQKFQSFIKSISTPMCTTSINNYFRCLHYDHSQKPIFDLVYKYYYTNVLKIQPNINFNIKQITFRVFRNFNIIPSSKFISAVKKPIHKSKKFDAFLSPSYPWHLYFV